MKPLAALLGLAAIAGLPTMNVLRVASAVQNGETITIGTTVFEVKSLGGTPTAGRTVIDLTASPTAAKASKLLTFAGNATANDTVSINSQVYTFKASVTTTANEVLIGATLTDTRNNLLAAVNAGTGAGTLYGSATVANTAVTASATSTDGLTATAKIAGTAGNAIAIAEAGSNTSWASAATTLSGGVDPTAAEAVDAIVLAINSVVCGLRAVEVATNEILLRSPGPTAAAIACTETLAGSNNGFAAATSYGGERNPDDLPITKVIQRAVLAVEVAVGAMRFPLEFTPTAVSVVVKTSAGVAKAWDGVATIGTKLVTVDISGSSDYAAGDLVILTASR